MSLTTDPNDPRLGRGVDTEKVQQNEVYLVLSEEEKAKGFVRPVRESYVHIGKKIERKGEIMPLDFNLDKMSEWAQNHYTKENGYAAFLKYPESEGAVVGKFLTEKELEEINSEGDYVGGCGTSTRMGLSIAETYARNPKFYGSTYCCYCMKHLPVGEFVWEGTDEIVGS